MGRTTALATMAALFAPAVVVVSCSTFTDAGASPDDDAEAGSTDSDVPETPDGAMADADAGGDLGCSGEFVRFDFSGAPNPMFEGTVPGFEPASDDGGLFGHFTIAALGASRPRSSTRIPFRTRPPRSASARACES